MPYYVQGIQTDSANEYYVSQVFDQLYGINSYQYQVPIMGGTSLRGGQVLDFLLDLAPLPIPVLVQGEYWHNNPAAEAFREMMIHEYGKGYWDELVKLEENETGSFDSAYDAVKRKIR